MALITPWVLKPNQLTYLQFYSFNKPKPLYSIQNFIHIDHNKTNNEFVNLRTLCLANNTFFFITMWLLRQKKRKFQDRKENLDDIVNARSLSVVHLLSLFALFCFNWKSFWIAFGLSFIIGHFGTTLGYHRILTYKSFKLPKWLEYTFPYFGVHAFQCGERTTVGDLEKQQFYKFLQETYFLHLAALGVLLYALGGFPFLVWGMGVRIVWDLHATFLVNSACHTWGNQSWNTNDLSKNNWLAALSTAGEGWHKNHHAFEFSARHGLEWWQIDTAWSIVRFLEVIGLATDVKLPTEARKQKLAFVVDRSG